MLTKHTQIIALALALPLALAVPASVQGQDGPDNGSDSPFSIGLQSSWPAYGVSGKMDLSPSTQVQVVLGALGNVTTVSGRAYRFFDRQPKVSWYGFGTLGLWRWSDVFYSESAVGFGGGAGVELDWREILDSPDFPRLASTVDLGLTMASFDTYENWSLLSFGVGFHYHF